MIAVWLEPTSTSKALRGLDPAVLGALDFISPNRYELQAIATAVTGRAVEAHTVADVKALLALVRAITGYRGWASLLSGALLVLMLQTRRALLRRHSRIPHFIVKMGPDGILVPTDLDASELYVHVVVKPPPTIVSVTGAGDRLVPSKDPFFLRVLC